MTIRWGIAGPGRMAEAFVPDFAEVPGAECVAVGSRSQERAGAFASTYGVARAHGSYRALIDDPEVDVVYVATPHPQHLAIASAAIEAGKAVLVEKAFTATLAGAQRLADLAHEREVFCMEAMWTRFQPAVVKARELIDLGEIGDVVAVQADLGAYRAYAPETRLFAPELGGGATLDLGVYVVSLAQHFLGRPDSVRAVGTTYPNGVDATVTTLLSYAGGRSAALVCTLESESAGRATIMGTHGSIELQPRFHHPSSFVLRRHGREPETVTEPPAGRGYSHEIAEVTRCVAGGLVESPVMPLADTLAVQAVLQETLEQLGITPAEADVEL